MPFKFEIKKIVRWKIGLKKRRGRQVFENKSGIDLLLTRMMKVESITVRSALYVAPKLSHASENKYF